MERLDYYDILPKGMDAYLASHGHHFSKPLLEFAVKRMDKNPKLFDRAEFDRRMSVYGLKLKRDDGYYDGIYVWCMAESDYMGSSIVDEMHLAKYVRDYIDDEDGNPTRAFDEFITNCMAKGVDLPWQDLI